MKRVILVLSIAMFFGCNNPEPSQLSEAGVVSVAEEAQDVTITQPELTELMRAMADMILFEEKKLFLPRIPGAIFEVESKTYSNYDEKIMYRSENPDTQATRRLTHITNNGLGDITKIEFEFEYGFSETKDGNRTVVYTFEYSHPDPTITVSTIDEGSQELLTYSGYSNPELSQPNLFFDGLSGIAGIQKAGNNKFIIYRAEDRRDNGEYVHESPPGFVYWGEIVISEQTVEVILNTIRDRYDLSAHYLYENCVLMRIEDYFEDQIETTEEFSIRSGEGSIINYLHTDGESDSIVPYVRIVDTLNVQTRYTLFTREDLVSETLINY